MKGFGIMKDFDEDLYKHRLFIKYMLDTRQWSALTYEK